MMLGVLGGMGPMATLDFAAKVIRHTPAQYDQDHIPMVICQAVDIPDRSDAILGNGPSPLPAMRDALRRLETAGVDYVAMPCNTAHFWHASLQAETALPILHMVDAVADYLDGEGAAEVGILATTGTLKTDVYQAALSKRGVAWRTPSDNQPVMQAIRLVKAGSLNEAATILQTEIGELSAAGCSHALMACTEIPLALSTIGSDLGIKLVDATEVLAIAAVQVALTKTSRAMATA